MINIEEHIGLAYKIASDFYNKYWEMSADEINSIALLGLVKARDRFSEEKGVKFTTFARVTIEYEIKANFFRDKSKFIRKRINGKEAYERMYIDSLNVEIKSAEKVELGDCLVAAFDMDKELDNIALREALNKLNESQREVIRMIYFEGKTQKEIAKIKRVTQAVVSRRKIKALNILKKFLAA